MPRPSSAALPIAYVVLRILIVLNWIYGARRPRDPRSSTFVAEQWTFTALGVPPSADRVR